MSWLAYSWCRAGSNKREKTNRIGDRPALQQHALGDRQGPALGAGALGWIGDLLEVDHMSDAQDTPDHLAGREADRVAQQGQQERASKFVVRGRVVLSPQRLKARGETLPDLADGL